MNFNLSFNEFKLFIEISEQQPIEKGNPVLWRLTVTSAKTVFNKAYETKAVAMTALDNYLHKWLGKENSQCYRVVLANVREALQALQHLELTNEKDTDKFSFVK